MALLHASSFQRGPIQGVEIWRRKRSCGRRFGTRVAAIDHALEPSHYYSEDP
ncbi:MAG: hypothetical protein HQ582_28930 [Planctomycetes bacterium]|nr:hypothetical protein [Planctomycetota bacterium]